MKAAQLVDILSDSLEGSCASAKVTEDERRHRF
jgi:hypothetical protein